MGDLPDSIPMVKKKSRGRPRKYPRLDDVLRYKNSLQSDDIEPEEVVMEDKETTENTKNEGNFSFFILRSHPKMPQEREEAKEG